MNTCDICGKPILPKKKLCDECEKGLNIVVEEEQEEGQEEEQEAKDDVPDEEE